MVRIMRLLFCLAIASAATLAGCSQAGAIAYMVTPPPSDPAAYKLGKTPTLVLAENYENPAQFEVYAERIDRDVSNQLTENKAGRIIEPAKLMALDSTDKPKYHQMDIPAVGRALGAKQVIYVDLVQFSVILPIGGESLSGQAEAHVRIVDVASGRTLWPLDSSTGRLVKAKTTYEQSSTDNNPVFIQDQLYQKLTDQIARLFYNAPTDRIDGGDREYDQKL